VSPSSKKRSAEELGDYELASENERLTEEHERLTEESGQFKHKVRALEANFGAYEDEDSDDDDEEEESVCDGGP
jgi:hypothetical protein